RTCLVEADNLTIEVMSTLGTSTRLRLKYLVEAGGAHLALNIWT
ncbi:9719_t:CDS:1, partial [Paraglomus occultum]